MEPGHVQLQIFVSLVVIVAAAVVALICDFLKRNNEQLRELTIELNIRHQEEQKRSRQVASRPAEPLERAPKAEKVVAPPAAQALAAPKERPATAVKERKRTVNSEALAAMERGAALAGSGGRPRSQAAAPAPKPERTPEVVVVSQQQPAAPNAAKKDWGSLLNRNAHAKIERKPVEVVTVNKDLLAAVVASHSSSAQLGEMSLPAGFQDGFVLNKLVQSHQPVSGLVVSIGVNAVRKADGSLPESVHQLVQSLIGPNDFAAQSGDDEFLLIYPQEQGASAQRRLSQIAQQLWDFQLRSLGSFQILFSWGGVEVRSESIEEAIASASQRMQETKRGRKLLTMWSPAPPVQTQLRRAV